MMIFSTKKLNMIITRILVLLSLLIVVSCSSEEEESIIGTWDLRSLDLECANEPELTQLVNASDGCVTVEGETTCISFTFHNESSGTLSFMVDGKGQNSDFIYSLNDTGSTLELCDANMKECSTFVIRGSEMALVDNLEGCDAEYVFEKQ